jgi:hypothetical protein
MLRAALDDGYCPSLTFILREGREAAKIQTSPRAGEFQTNAV